VAQILDSEKKKRAPRTTVENLSSEPCLIGSFCHFLNYFRINARIYEDCLVLADGLVTIELGVVEESLLKALRRRLCSGICLLDGANCVYSRRGRRGTREALLHLQNGFHGHGCGKTAVSDSDTGGPIFIDPPDFPTSIFTLQRKQSTKINVVA
jgi:hypothetical protein